MQRNLRFLVAVAVFLAVALVTWGVEAQQPMPGVQGSPAPMDPYFEGKVKKVDPAARTVEISIGLLGFWGKTLEVTDATQIQAEGRQATLADIPEGARVKASYETRGGKSFATRIDLLPPPKPNESPGQPGPKTQ